MTKRSVALLFLLCLLTSAMGGSGTAPSMAAPTPSLIAPDTCEQPDPQWGGCRWYCGSKSYLTRAQCQANCSTTCEPIC